LRNKVCYALGTIFLSACGVQTDEHEHEPILVTIEGPSITEALDTDRVSEALEAEAPFERLAVLYDAPDPTALELSTSPDGNDWTEFAVPIVTFAEEGAHVANLDLVEPARFYRYRIRDLAIAPTFIAFDTIETMPIPEAGDPPPADLADEEEMELLALAEALPEQDEGFGSTKSGISTRIGNVTVHSRAAWNARAPNCISSTTPNRVTIHHTVTPTRDSLSPQARLRQIQNFHMNSRGWCDIGYNFLVSRDGRLWRGRGSTRLGAHVANNNSGNVGISFMGTHTNTTITNKQMCNTAKLLSWLDVHRPAVSLNRSDVKGHRQYGGTSCPGNSLYGQLDRMVRWAKNGCP
jgi:hypothetical protein